MKVALQAQAEADLRDIARWIARDNPNRARSFSAELRAKCETLARSPKAFPVVRTTRLYAIRKHTHGRYLIFYVIHENRIEVLRIAHGARDWAALFGDGDKVADL